jgi:hypothetical protein
MMENAHRTSIHKGVSRDKGLRGGSLPHNARRSRMAKPFAVFFLLASGMPLADDFTVDFRNATGYGVSNAEQLQIDNIVVNFLATNPLTGQPVETSSNFNVLWQWQFSTASLVIADIPQTCAGDTSLTVNLTEALTGTPLSGVALQAGTESGISDANGLVTFAGLSNPTVEVTANIEGYVTTSQTIELTCGESNTIGFAMLSSTDVGTLRGDIRINLTWGENPEDLDAHLTGPKINATSPDDRFHIYFSNRNNCDAAPCDTTIPAWLDVDDVTGFGPENITIQKVNDAYTPGTYRFSMHHYAGSSTIPDSGAAVKVYVGDTLARTYKPVANGEAVAGGWLWTVVEIAIDATGGVSFNEIGTLTGPTSSIGIRSVQAPRVNKLGRVLVGEDRSVIENLPAK